MTDGFGLVERVTACSGKQTGWLYCRTLCYEIVEVVCPIGMKGRSVVKT